MSWYDTGYDALKKEENRQALAGGPKRFWMPAESSKDVILVDSEPFAIMEHNPKIDGSWDNHTTCLNGVDDDVACCDLLGMKGRYFVGYYTCIDCSKYTDKKNVVHQFELKFFPAKMRTLKKLRRKAEEKGSLAGAMFRATRDDKKSPQVGDEFEFQKTVDLATVFPHVSYNGKKLVDMWAKVAGDADALARLQKLFKIDLDATGAPKATVPAFNYLELLRPLPAKEIRTKFTGAKIEAFDDAAPTGKTNTVDEDIPF